MSKAFGTKGAWKEWVQERESSLPDPYGWLSLVELEWLSEEPRTLDNFPGKWSCDGDTVTAVFSDEEPKVYREDQQVESPLLIQVIRGESDRSLRDETGREIEVAYRFWGPCVRVRDPHAKRLQDFQGLDRYDFDPQWVLRGRLVPYAEPIEIEVESAVEGGSHKVQSWALADFALPGDEEMVSLEVTGADPESSQVMFFDETNGDSTPGWRTAKAAVDGETVVVDFNRAAIFPAHLSPFGTCPKPPANNRINRRVEAGEKKFEGRDTK